MSESKPQATLKGPPSVRPWNTMDASKDGCPCVIKRRFKYWQTNLSRLAKAEAALTNANLRADKGLLRAKAENRKRWVEFSSATLQNSIRFARARITQGSEDYKTLSTCCPNCREDTTHFNNAKPFVTASLENGKTELRCLGCCKVTPSVKLKYDVKRRPLGRSNKKFHKELRYYDSVLDSFFMAKKAASGSSFSEVAMEGLLKLSKKSIQHFKFQSAREVDDAEQTAMIGLLEAAKRFNPAVSNLAKFTTYASFWIRRKSQARKTAHCKPGLAIVAGKHVGTHSMDATDDNSRTDTFHPGARTINSALQLDVALALEALPEEEREIVKDNLLRNVTLRDLAEKYGMTVGKIRTIVNRNKDRLAEKLHAHADF